MKNHFFNLRWFDGEGTAQQASAAAEAENATTGVGTQEDDPQNILFGKQPETAAPEEETPKENNVSYKDFKKQFKQEFQADLQRVIDKRFRNQKQAEAQRDALKTQNEQYTSLVKALSQRYGTDDIEQLTKELTNDKEWREEQALKEGLPLEAYDRIQSAEAKASDATSQLEDMQRQAIIQGWEQEAEELTTLYPEFNFADEIENEKFGFALQSGMSVRDAYQYAHFDDIFSGAIQYTAAATKNAVAKAKAQRQSRPPENGTKSAAAAVVKSDVGKLTKQDMEEIDKRVLRGERISFS